MLDRSILGELVDHLSQRLIGQVGDPALTCHAIHNHLRPDQALIDLGDAAQAKVRVRDMSGGVPGGSRGSAGQVSGRHGDLDEETIR
ncbi:hypothetical protein KEM55_000928, partial [Ascosphaera atra]